MTEEIQAVAPEMEATEAVATTENENLEAQAEPTEPVKVEEQPFPKKAVNAITRRDRQIGKLKAELEALRRAQSETQKPQTEDNQAPKEEDFENYGEYLKAAAKHEAKQEFANQRKADTEAQLAQKEQEWAAERMASIEEIARDIATKVPDYQQVHAEHMDIVESLPIPIQMAFLEVENAPLAFYALAKEGKLESLANMTPARAAIEIGKAEDRGMAMTKKPVTKAPAPIGGVKGQVGNSKLMDNMSWDELKKEIYS